MNATWFGFNLLAKSKAGFRQEIEIGGEKYGFCWIPPGEFTMGSPKSEEGRQYYGETQHHVTLTRGF